MYKSLKHINSIDDLNKLKLVDKKIYDEFIQDSTCPASSWWAQFTYFFGYSFRRDKKSFWVIVDGLFVPFLYNQGKFFLLILPFGKASVDVYCDVIYKCLEFCDKHSKYSEQYTKVMWMNEDQKLFLETSKKFNTLFKKNRASVGPEYHYYIDELNLLEGKKFSYIRRKINKFERNFSNVTFKEYEDSEYDKMIHFYNQWHKEASDRYSSIYDKDFFPEILKNKNKLQIIIIVAYNQDEIIGMTSGQIGVSGEANCFFRKSLQSYDGLSQFLVIKLVQYFKKNNPTLTIFNDGGAGDTKGLNFFKEQFRPIATIDRYRLRLKEIKIISTQVFLNTSFVSFYPSARFVIDSYNNHFWNKVLSKEKLNQCKQLIDLVLKNDLKQHKWEIENTPDMIIAQFAILIQKASNFKLSNYGSKLLSKTRCEIYFECRRSEIVFMIERAIKLLIDFIIEKNDGSNLVTWYKNNRNKLGCTLNEYIQYDRVETANRMGVDASYQDDVRDWIGQGKNTKLISLGYTQNTPRLGYTIASNKATTNKYLQDYGLPVPKQFSISNENSFLNLNIDFPVVLKPRNGSRGRNVITDIKTMSNLLKIYKEKKAYEGKFVVEEYIPGEDYRLLVVNGKFIAAVKRLPAHIVGDGIHSIKELVYITNIKQRRDGLYLLPIIIDNNLKMVIKKQRMTLDTILEEKRVLNLREAANVSLGGTTVDVTAQVHPDNKSAAILAAKCCLLDVAGVDFMTKDISKSYRDGFGKIIEVNSGPGVDLHMIPTSGEEQEVSSHFIRSHFKVNENSNIPTIAIVGKWNKESVIRECSFIYATLGVMSGAYSNKVITIGNNKTKLSGDYYDNIKTLVHHKNIETALMTWPMNTIVFKGFPLNKVTCMVFTDFMNEANISEKIYDENISNRIYKRLADICTNGVVVNGDNLNLIKSINHLPPFNIVKVFLTKIDSLSSQMKEHLKSGGRLLKINTSNTVTWHENGNEYNIGNISASLISERMYALAAILTSGIKADRFQNSLIKFNNFKKFSTTLLNFSNNKANISLVDPRDLESLQILQKTQLESKTLTWLILSEEMVLSNELEQWINGFSKNNIFVIFTGKKERHINNSIYIPTVETAYNIIAKKAYKQELIIVLQMNEAKRIKNLKELQNIDFNNLSNFKNPLNFDDIEEIFDGRWINNLQAKGNFEKVCWGEKLLKKNTLTILPGTYNDVKLIQSSQIALQNSFENGSKAVISSVLSPDLPRWRPVFLCDDPLIGLLKLSDLKRQYIKGDVVLFLSSKSFFDKKYEQMHSSLLKNKNTEIYLADMDYNIDQYIFNSTTIINTPLDLNYKTFLYPQVSLDPLSFRILNANILIIDTFNIETEVEIMESLLLDISSILILTSSQDNEYWSKYFADNDKVTIIVMTRRHSITKKVLDFLYGKK